MILNLVFVAMAILMVMAGRRRYRRYLRGNIDFTMALGTLGNKTAISATVADTVIEKAWCSSVKCSYSMSGYTAVQADGPLLVGVAHGDYTSTEIEEWIESVDSWEETDQIGQEIGRRKIRRIGQFDIPPNTAPEDTIVLNDGKMISTKTKYVFSTGQTVRFWVYNQGTGALTTGAILSVQGHANLWPM